MKIVAAISILCLIFFYGCSKDDTAEGTAKIGIDFVWDLGHLKRSPEVHLENVPAGVDSRRLHQSSFETQRPCLWAFKKVVDKTRSSLVS
ncbi:MAG: hypothetical protein HGJ94_10370 [Desulfosarcina sp.]|nr:hypothetical protein [Desulfosarcina sp.]